MYYSPSKHPRIIWIFKSIKKNQPDENNLKKLNITNTQMTNESTKMKKNQTRSNLVRNDTFSYRITITKTTK